VCVCDVLHSYLPQPFGTDPCIKALTSPNLCKIRLCIRNGIISSAEEWVPICIAAQSAIDTGTWETWTWNVMDRQGLTWTLDLDHHYQHHDQFHIDIGFPQESPEIQRAGQVVPRYCRHVCRRLVHCRQVAIFVFRRFYPFRVEG
jgi:hypothetical protein